MAGKRFEETKVVRISPGALVWECSACKEQFDFFSPAEPEKPPKFCPNCGRRNA